MHSQSCSGCPHCSPEMRAILSMSSREYVRFLESPEYARYLSGKKGGTLRTAGAANAAPPPPDFVAALKRPDPKGDELTARLAAGRSTIAPAPPDVRLAGAHHSVPAPPSLFDALKEAR